MKKSLAVIISLTLCCFLMTGFLGNGLAETGDFAVIRAYGYMASYGIDITRFEISVPNGANYVSLLPEDFTVEGVVNNALDTTPKAGRVARASASEHVYYLDVEPFLWNESRETLRVTCANKELSFTGADVSQVICPELDAFTSEIVTVGGTTVKYKLYTPENAEGKQHPVIVYNHGGGATGPDGVLTDDSFSCAFATKDSQKIFPCYVIAPYRASVADATVNADEEMQAIKAILDQLVSDGKADPERLYMGGESMGSIYSISFANRYPDYLAAIVLMNGGPFEIEEGTPLEEAKAMELASPWSDAELKALAASKTAVMFVQGLADTLSVPIRYAAVYAKLEDFGMIPGADLIWNAYTHEEFNMLLKGSTKINYRGIENVIRDPITGKESYQNGLCHNSSRAAGWDMSIRRWLRTRTLNSIGLSGSTEASPFEGISFPDFVTKAQIIPYTVEEGGQTATFDVYAGADDAVSQVYFGFDAGYFCEIMGSVKDGQVTVTYESFAGFLAHYAQPMYEQIDPDGWTYLTDSTQASGAQSSSAWEAEELPQETPADEAIVSDSGYVFFGGDLSSTGGSGAKVELNADRSAQALTGYFGADGKTVWATYGQAAGTWEASENGIKLTLTSETHETSREYTGTEADGLLYEDAGLSWLLSYQPDQSCFSGGDLTESGGNGVVISLKEDGTAHLVFGYVGADGHTVYAEYSSSDGTYTLEDGIYRITIRQAVTSDINEVYDISPENGFSYQGYTLTLQATITTEETGISEPQEAEKEVKAPLQEAIDLAPADSGITAQGEASMTFGLTSRFLWQEYADGSVVVSQIMGGVVEGGVYSSPPVVCTYWGNVTHLENSAHFTFDAFRWSTAYATEAEQAQMAADNPEMTAVQMYINVIEDAQVTDGAYEVEFIYDLAGATTQPVRISVEPTQTPVDASSWKRFNVEKIVAELEAAGLREAGVPLPVEEESEAIVSDFVKNSTCAVEKYYPQ